MNRTSILVPVGALLFFLSAVAHASNYYCSRYVDLTDGSGANIYSNIFPAESENDAKEKFREALERKYDRSFDYVFCSAPSSDLKGLQQALNIVTATNEKNGQKSFYIAIADGTSPGTGTETYGAPSFWGCLYYDDDSRKFFRSRVGEIPADPKVKELERQDKITSAWDAHLAGNYGLDPDDTSHCTWWSTRQKAESYLDSAEEFSKRQGGVTAVVAEWSPSAP